MYDTLLAAMCTIVVCAAGSFTLARFYHTHFSEEIQETHLDFRCNAKTLALQRLSPAHTARIFHNSEHLRWRHPETLKRHLVPKQLSFSDQQKPSPRAPKATHTREVPLKIDYCVFGIGERRIKGPVDRITNPQFHKCHLNPFHLNMDQASFCRGKGAFELRVTFWLAVTTSLVVAGRVVSASIGTFSSCILCRFSTVEGCRIGFRLFRVILPPGNHGRVDSNILGAKSREDDLVDLGNLGKISPVARNLLSLTSQRSV